MPITVLNKDNVPTGPFTRAQVAEKLQSGEFSLTSLAFVEGLSEWTPLRDVLARVDAASPSAPLPLPAVTPPAGAPAYSYAATMQPPTHLVYAGFWIRFVAWILDQLIIFICWVIFWFCIIFPISLLIAFGLIHATGEWLNSDSVVVEILRLGVTLVYQVVILIYYAALESGYRQATFGKRILGLRVTKLDGKTVTFAHAACRFLGKYVSMFILMIGFIMAGFTERKQALHDMLAGTLVVKE